MKKILALIVVIFLAVALFAQLNDKPKEVVYADTPTEQEQQAIEETQEAPQAILENDMESQFPENAERD